MNATGNKMTEVLNLSLRFGLTIFGCILFLFSDFARLVLVLAIIVLGVLTQGGNVGLWGSYLPPPILRHEMVFPNADVLAFRENSGLNTIEFRLLVNAGTDEKAIKYATVSSNVTTLGIRKERYSETSVVQMPILPKGDYCSVNIGLGPDGKQAVCTTTSCQRLPGAKGANWHGDAFDILDLEILPWTNSTDRVQLVQHSSLASPAVMKYSPFSHDIESISQEIKMYEYLQGSNIAPRFLGQVVEYGRVIGFLIGYIKDARLVSGSGRFSDLAIEKCKKALGELHEMAIIHNDAHLNNCLLRPNGEPVLIDFEHATLAATADPEDFERDFRLLSN